LCRYCLIVSSKRLANLFADEQDPKFSRTKRETGHNSREIADELAIAEGTVKNYVLSILSKMGVRDRTRAVLKALESKYL